MSTEGQLEGVCRVVENVYLDGDDYMTVSFVKTHRSVQQKE